MSDTKYEILYRIIIKIAINYLYSLLVAIAAAEDAIERF